MDNLLVPIFLLVPIVFTGTHFFYWYPFILLVPIYFTGTHFFTIDMNEVSEVLFLYSMEVNPRLGVQYIAMSPSPKRQY